MSQTSRWLPYPEYKESGIEWLGEIPAHWETTLLKRGFNVQLGKMLQSTPTSVEDTLEPYLRAANIFWTGVDISNVKEMWFSPYEKKQYALKKGDLLISEGGDVGRAAIWRGELRCCYIQNAINRVRSEGRHSTRFLYYWIYTLKHSGYIDMLCNKATIAHFTAEKVERVEVALPPLPEQRAIADFLDRETAKLDALIAKKRRLIELLGEKRAALISQAVSKGLNPEAPMKDSGVEWLGEIPAHWELVRIKYLLHQIIDTEHKTAPFYPNGEYLVVRTTNVRNGKLTLNGAKYTDYEGYKDWTRRGVPKPGDIIFTREAPAGEACLVPGGIPLCIGQRTVLFRVNNSVLDGSYGVWSIYGGVSAEFIQLLSQGSTVAHFNMADIGNIPILTPPLKEQLAIVDYLDQETAKIDALIGKTEETIEKLREYRTALISAAVTGKIDVRGAVKGQANFITLGDPKQNNHITTAVRGA